MLSKPQPTVKVIESGCKARSNVSCLSGASTILLRWRGLSCDASANTTANRYADFTTLGETSVVLFNFETHRRNTRFLSALRPARRPAIRQKTRRP